MESCDCNNQSFEGVCVDGLCITKARTACSKSGATQSCSPPGRNCIGTQSCQPAYLFSPYWGDCDCNSTPKDDRNIPDAGQERPDSSTDQLNQEPHPADKIAEQKPESVEPDKNRPPLPDDECSLASNPLGKKPCAAGKVCVRVDNLHTRCFVDCTVNQGLCQNDKEGRTTCRQVAFERTAPYKPISACVKVVGENDPCDLAQAIVCRSDNTGHLVCKDGKCVKGKLVQVAGAACGTRLQPPVECDIEKKLACSSKSPGAHFCESGIPVFEGESCVAGRKCAPNHVCLTIPSHPKVPVCMLYCNPQLPQAETCQHRPNFFCFQSGQLGFCFQEKCRSYHDCVFKDPFYTCGQESRSNKLVCTPYETGNQELGEKCNGSVLQWKCKAPNICTGITSTTSMCLPKCRDDADCQSVHPKLKCVSSPPFSTCLWPCQTNADCPKGVCTGQYCAQSKP